MNAIQHRPPQTSRRLGNGLLLAGLLSLPTTGLADPFAAAMAEAQAGRHGAAAAGFHDLALIGDGEAAYNLSLLFHFGQGVPQNDSEAAFWAWKSRLTGVKRAEQLVRLLWDRLAVEQKTDIAQRLESDLLVSASSGDGPAMLALAIVFLDVRPTPDPAQAYVWQSLAAALDVTGAVPARDATLRHMDDAARLQAQAQAMQMFRDWCARDLDQLSQPCAVVNG